MRATLRLFLPLVALGLAFAFPPAAAADDNQDFVVISGPVTVAEGETVDNVFVIDGDVTIDGTVDGDVFVVDGVVEVNGEITGDLTTIDDDPVIASGGTVGGEINAKEDFPDFGGRWWIAPLALWLAITFSTLVLGLLLLLLAPRAADATYRQASEGPWASVAAGFGVFILLPVLAVIAGVTLVGLPLGIALLLLLLPLMAIAYTTSCWLLGRRLVRPPRGRFRAFLAGWGILRVLALIPAVGVLVWIGAAIFGLGVLALALWRARTPAEPGPPPEPGPPEAPAATTPA
jgi:hypothetical protein